MTEKLSADTIEGRLKIIKANIAEAAKKAGKTENDIILLAATKTVEPERINEAISCGLCYVAENRVQELKQKHELIDKTAHQHFIGHLQTNKVKDVVGRVELIHSVHSLKLAREISAQAQNKKITVPVLLQVNVGNEESKSGFAPEETENAVRETALLPGIKVMGLMAIPPVCDSPEKTGRILNKCINYLLTLGTKT